MTGHVSSAFSFLVDSLFGLYIVALLLRYILQVVRADFYNPLAQFIWRVTHAPVNLVQRAVPRWKRHDFAALLLAYLASMANLWIDLALIGISPDPASLLLWSVLKLAWLVCNLYFFSILVQALMSWITPGAPTPANVLLWSINEPLLRPIREFLPPLGGIDLSPLVAMIALQMLMRLLPPLPGLLG
jgi:YggT family protein